MKCPGNQMTQKNGSAVPGVWRRQFTGWYQCHSYAPSTRQSAGEKQKHQQLITVFWLGYIPNRWPVSASTYAFFVLFYKAVIKKTIVCLLAWEQAGRNSTEYLSELFPLSLIGLSWLRNRVMLVMNRAPPGPGFLFTAGLIHSSTIIPWVLRV